MSRRHALLRHAPRGQALPLMAAALAVFVLLALGLWVGLRQRADYALITRLAAAAAHDGSLVLSDASLAGGTPAPACGAVPCDGATCPQVMAADPGGTSAVGQACRSFATLLGDAFPGRPARVDVAATLAHTRVWGLAAGDHEPEGQRRLLHYPTVCLASDVAIGLVESDGASLRYHIGVCHDMVYP